MSASLLGTRGTRAAIPLNNLRRSVSPFLNSSESRASILHLYKKICRTVPQVLKGYELEGEDSYHRAVRNLRFFFEHHRALKDQKVIEMLRQKAENEIQEALLLYKTKSHVANLLFEEPQLASIVRANEEIQKLNPTERNSPSPFLQSFFAGSA